MHNNHNDSMSKENNKYGNSDFKSERLWYYIQYLLYFMNYFNNNIDI